jgi:uncharacterized protein (DUF1697 family)
MIILISILRGINLGGRNTVKMDDLRKLFIDLGFINVRTYIQSGNIIYQSKKLTSKQVNEVIESNIKRRFGFDVPAVTLQLEELTEICRSNPFTKDNTKDTSFLHVTFLSARPKAGDINKIKEQDFKPDEFREGGNVIYVYCPGGYGRTKLSNSFFEKKLKVTATTRNWKVTNELLSIAKEITDS